MYFYIAVFLLFFLGFILIFLAGDFMILNTGARTDLVQYFTPWLVRRFREGFVYVRNPLFPNKVTRYEISPEKVDVVLFCSKNYSPVLPYIKEISDKYRTYFHYTITAYGKDLEPGVPSVDESAETLISLSKIVGKQKVAWRYDPVLLTKKYTVESHARTFEHLAKILAPHIDRCIFSFVEMYKKLQFNMPELVPLSHDDIERLCAILGGIAKKYGIFIQTCGTECDFSDYGIHKSGCTTLQILGNANGCEFKKLKHGGMRSGCACIASRDIGEYETCLNGCKYCYANKNHLEARKRFSLHNPESPILIGNLLPDDVVSCAEQKSFLLKENQSDLQENLQLRLF